MQLPLEMQLKTGRRTKQRMMVQISRHYSLERIDTLKQRIARAAPSTQAELRTELDMVVVSRNRRLVFAIDSLCPVLVAIATTFERVRRYDEAIALFKEAIVTYRLLKTSRNLIRFVLRRKI